MGSYQPNTIAWGQHAPRMHEHATWCPSPPCIYATHPTTRALFIASALLDMECACNQRFDGVQHIYSLCAQMHPEQPVPFHYLLNCQMHYSKVPLHSVSKLHVTFPRRSKLITVAHKHTTSLPLGVHIPNNGRRENRREQ